MYPDEREPARLPDPSALVVPNRSLCLECGTFVNVAGVAVCPECLGHYMVMVVDPQEPAPMPSDEGLQLDRQMAIDAVALAICQYHDPHMDSRITPVMMAAEAAYYVDAIITAHQDHGVSDA